MDGKLSLVVKADSSDISDATNRNNLYVEMGKPTQEVPTEFKVQMEYTPRRATGKGRKTEFNSDWTFTCPCPSNHSMCKHVGACLVVHFH